MALDGETGADLVKYNTPGRAVAIHPAGGRAIAAFMFRAPEIANFDHRDLEQYKSLLAAAYAGAGWRVPELPDRVRATGMPTSEMREFAELLAGGIETHKRRLEILLAHRQRIVARQQRLADCLNAVDAAVSGQRYTDLTWVSAGRE